MPSEHFHFSESDQIIKRLKRQITQKKAAIIVLYEQ